MFGSEHQYVLLKSRELIPKANTPANTPAQHGTQSEHSHPAMEAKALWAGPDSSKPRYPRASDSTAPPGSQSAVH